MKKTCSKDLVFWFGLALAGFLPMPAANAQNSVTLYGILDAGVTWVSNAGGSQLIKFDDGISYVNRVGLKGDEDLGSGLHAIFALESDLSLGTGNYTYAGDGFARLAYLGLKGEFGTVSLGNQADMTSEYVYLFDISSWASGYGSTQGDFDRMFGDHLFNAIKYMSPDFGGVSFGGMYSFGNVAGDFHHASDWSIGAHYALSSFSVGVAYTLLNNPTGQYAFDPYAMLGVSRFLGRATTANDPATGRSMDLFATSAFPVDRQGTLGVGASYGWDKLTISGTFTYTGIKAFAHTSYMKVYQGGAGYSFTPALTLYGGYQRTEFEGNHWNQCSLGLHYLLSLRTEIYISGDYLGASSGVNSVIAYSFPPSSTNVQSDLRIGMRHSF